MTMTPLPIDPVLPLIADALAVGDKIVLAAPPGAGKTTRVPLSLLDAPWAEGKILLLEPRRIAARLAAARMAASLGERVGDTVGLATRIERKVSDATRIEVITDGLFTRRILADPELTGVCAILFDEFHERSLNLDLGLALAREAQSALREDLKLVVMSATLDVASVAVRLNARAIESAGRAFPVDTRYLGRAETHVSDQVAAAVRRALSEETGSILAFLPGRGEIERTAAALDDLNSNIDVAPLYGALSPRAQDAAVSPALKGRRKVVLATDIAESSLTIEGVRIVIDAGLARRARHDPSSGATRLVTERASLANVDQRRGRAGRTEPGVCYRLWNEPETRGLAAQPDPEILTADLSGLVLALAEWGESDPRRLPFIDPPPASRIAAARALLMRLGALDGDGALTAGGRDMARLPMDVRHAALIFQTKTKSEKALAARIAALLSEPGLGGRSVDLRDRITGLERDRSVRAETMKRQAARWGGVARPAASEAAGALIARADPTRIARRVRSSDGAYLLAGGGEARLDPADTLANENWLAVAEIVGAAARARITAAAPLSERDALAIGAIETTDAYDLGADGASLKGRRLTRLGAIRLTETPLPAPKGEAARAALVEIVARRGLELLPVAPAIRTLRQRVSLVEDRLSIGAEDLSDDVLLARAEEWLTCLLGDPPSLAGPKPTQTVEAVLALFDWSLARDLNRFAPLKIMLPSGRSAPIDYAAEAGPTIAGKAQEFYGLHRHPSIADGAVPVVVTLVSPAGRPIATTTDLPGFWRGAYADMAKDMRARYPKHDWPEDPATAAPHAGVTKARLKKTTD